MRDFITGVLNAREQHCVSAFKCSETGMTWLIRGRSQTRTLQLLAANHISAARQNVSMPLNHLFVGKPTALFPVPRYQALSGGEVAGVIGQAVECPAEH